MIHQMCLVSAKSNSLTSIFCMPCCNYYMSYIVYSVNGCVFVFLLLFRKTCIHVLIVFSILIPINTGLSSFFMVVYCLIYQLYALSFDSYLVPLRQWNNSYFFLLVLSLLSFSLFFLKFYYLYVIWAYNIYMLYFQLHLDLTLILHL